MVVEYLVVKDVFCPSRELTTGEIHENDLIYSLNLKTSLMIRKVKDLFKTGYCKSSSPNCTV